MTTHKYALALLVPASLLVLPAAAQALPACGGPALRVGGAPRAAEAVALRTRGATNDAALIVIATGASTSGVGSPAIAAPIRAGDCRRVALGFGCAAECRVLLAGHSFVASNYSPPDRPYFR
jgi:hypothetical protein